MVYIYVFMHLLMDILVALSHIIFIILKYALTEFNIATLDSFWLVTAWYIILYPFPSPDFLYLKCVTYTIYQGLSFHIRFLFFYPTLTICLLIVCLNHSHMKWLLTVRAISTIFINCFLIISFIFFSYISA